MNRLRDREESSMNSSKNKLYRVIRVVDKMEAVESYWALNKDRFSPSSLERKVFSWSIDDIFNRDLLRHQVTSIEHRTRWWFCRDCLHTLFFCLISV